MSNDKFQLLPVRQREVYAIEFTGDKEFLIDLVDLSKVLDVRFSDLLYQCHTDSHGLIVSPSVRFCASDGQNVTLYPGDFLVVEDVFGTGLVYSVYQFDHLSRFVPVTRDEPRSHDLRGL